MVLTEQMILQTLMQWRTKISASAWLVVRNSHSAEDIFQNVVLKAMTRDLLFESESALLSWAMITARREGLDWLDRHRREVGVLDEGIHNALNQVWQSQRVSESGGRSDVLQECLEATSVESRLLLKLRYGDDLSCEEVAEKLSLGLNAVYKRLSRLHEALRQCVEMKLQAPCGKPSKSEGFAS